MPLSKQCEWKLRLSQFTIERAADAIFWHGPDAKFEHVNEAACAHLGYSQEELLTMRVQDINPDSNTKSWEEFWQEIQQSKTETFEARHRTKTGRIVPVEVNVNYIEFEGREYCCSFVRDISERQRIEKERACAFDEIQRLRKQLEEENQYLNDEVRQLQAYGDIVGQSPALRGVLHQIDMVAPTEATVLITGDTGTGKELVAREIHKRSQRSEHPMIKVNCASIPRELYESEFFGHVRGAFTGAVRDRIGRFELADGGTLFLDEVGEIPLDMQSKLLRILQEGTFERVGEEKTRKTNVRVLAATNRDLKQEAETGRFRADLFYRLNIFPIEMIPLKKRKDDIPLLASHLLNAASKNLNVPAVKLTKRHVTQLRNYDWPGNVRELQNVLERAIIVSRSGPLKIDLPVSGKDNYSPPPNQRTVSGDNRSVLTEGEMKRREKENIHRALVQTRWKVFGPGGAAELLDINPMTLVSRMKKMALRKPSKIENLE